MRLGTVFWMLSMSITSCRAVSALGISYKFVRFAMLRTAWLMRFHMRHFWQEPCVDATLAEVSAVKWVSAFPALLDENRAEFYVGK